jgi:glycolate oxidase
MRDYLRDATPEPAAPKASTDVVLVKPADSKEISNVLKLANEKLVPVVPRGAGTGLCGGAIPTVSGIVLSMERLDKILELNQDSMMITCEAGVTLESLFERVKKTGNLFFPPHPGDEGAQVGGLVVENAGGARAVKYGVMRNYVKGIKVVLPTGEVIALGGKVLKNNTGYDLMHLLIGSEGTLGIITEATLKLYPKSEESATLVIPYKDRHDAIKSVPILLKEGIMPLAVEYVEKDLIEKSANHLGKQWPTKKGVAYLILILMGRDEEELYSMGEVVSEVCEKNGATDILFAQRSKEQGDILDIRSNIYTALEEDTADILDVTVPPGDIGKLMDVIDEIAEEFGAQIPMYGHAADGNLHPHIMKINGEPPAYFEEIKERIYKETIAMGGVITGEHGIGVTRIKHLPLMFSEKEIAIMKGIKKVFDPNNILNPGKLF